MPQKLITTGMFVLTVAGTACSSRKPPAVAPTSPQQQIIAELKDFQKTLGLQHTENFSHYSTARGAFRCYFTGTLELPVSYRDLKITESDTGRCSVDARKYDVFVYAPEAVASGTAPITPALTNAPLERILVVVPHEDFHNQPEMRKSSPELAEGAATLGGFLTAAEFAKERFGSTSQTFQGLDREADLFLQKARIINAYYDRLSELYSSFERQSVSRREALRRKQQLFAELQRDCAAIVPEPLSFNKCPAAMNNAGLAFDRTYTRDYPMLFESYRSTGQDNRTSISGLTHIMTMPEDSQGGSAR